MGKLHKEITQDFIDFIAKQKVFFVATAPSNLEHHVNVSPRSPGTSIVVLDPHSVAMADLSGSGAETASHLLQNGRMTLMFVNLEEGAPRILRLYGKAQIKLPSEVDEALLARFPEKLTTSKGFRAVYILSVDRITSSCGFSMPVMTFESYRTVLDEHAAKTDMEAYRRLKNSFNFDGMPSISLLEGGDNAEMKPKPDHGYVFGSPIAKDEVAAIQDAHRLCDQLQKTPARGGKQAKGRGLDLNVATAALVAVTSFTAGIACCKWMQRKGA